MKYRRYVSFFKIMGKNSILSELESSERARGKWRKCWEYCIIDILAILRISSDGRTQSKCWWIGCWKHFKMLQTDFFSTALCWQKPPPEKDVFSCWIWSRVKEALKSFILWGGFRGSGRALTFILGTPKNSQNKLKDPSGLLPYQIVDFGPHFWKIMSLTFFSPHSQPFLS